MQIEYTPDYLLDKQVKIFQPVNGYRASTDAVLLSAIIESNTKNVSILDVGSGTGAISLCLAQRLKENNVKIIGIDIQKDLVDLANMSAKENGFDFLKYINIDIREKISNPDLFPCTFDYVITNPPYSDHDMPSPNLSKATAHNHSDFSLQKWLQFCLKMAKPFGKIIMVNRVEALPDACNAFYGKAANIKILPIYTKKDNKAKRIIISAQKDSKSPCEILPPFLVHNDDLQYTDNAQKVLRNGLSFSDIL